MQTGMFPHQGRVQASCPASSLRSTSVAVHLTISGGSTLPIFSGFPARQSLSNNGEWRRRQVCRIMPRRPYRPRRLDQEIPRSPTSRRVRPSHIQRSGRRKLRLLQHGPKPAHRTATASIPNPRHLQSRSPSQRPRNQHHPTDRPLIASEQKDTSARLYTCE